jgi:class 3 adenylate cyclase/predicted ATPase
MRQAADGSEERRQLTALFCDVVGSTELSSSLDPEDYFEVVRAYHERADEVVVHYGGHVAQYLGDGLLAYFGYPQAHEDAVERAVRAGLAIVDALGDLNRGPARNKNVRLSLRVSIHTGNVVLGPTGGRRSREVLAMGETLNLAARLQAIAAADTVVMSGDSERLVRGLFVLEDLGPQRLKGLARPIQAFRVAGPTGVRGRLDLLGADNLTPFFGRDADLHRLLEEWEQARRMHGRVVVISGEPGIGKSRLGRALRERLAGASYAWLEAHCSPWTQNTPFYPMIELHRRLLGVHDQDPAGETLARFEAALRDAGLVPDDALPVIAALHGIPLPEDRQPPPLSREGQRRKTLETLCEWLLRSNHERPAVFLVEDVQWIDPSTAELVGRVIERIADRPLLLLLTHRPGYTPPWTADARPAIRLERLAENEAMRIVEDVASAESLPPERMMEIVVRAEGVPLYLEELTKAVVESASVRAPDRGAAATQRPASFIIPATLRDSLMARLDRLGSAKELALLASVIGREFSYALIAAASPVDEEELRAQLAKLVESELVFQIGEPPDATYRFKHALIRDEAYQSLVRSIRRQYHTRIGETLETSFPQETATRPELVAHHFLEAGNDRTGVDYLTAAVRRAVMTSANVEAIHHADRALDVLSGQPRSPRRSELEMAICTLRGVALIAIRGYASDDVQRTFAQARELASAVADSPQLVPVLHGLWLFHMVRGDRKPTCELADQLLAIAEDSDDTTARLFGFTVAGIQAFFEGHFQEAVNYVQRAFALYEPQLHSPLAVTYSLGTAGVARANAATCLWFLGYPDQARDLVREVLEAARRDRHPFTIAGVDVMGAMVFHLCRDPDSTRPLEEEALRIANEQGFPLWIGGALCGLGSTLAELGSFDEGMDRIREGLAVYRATGGQTNTAFVLGSVAALCHAAGRLDDAESAVDEALELVERNLETFYAPELCRLKGEVMLARTGDERAAEALFERALSLARGEHAKSLELRAATSLARLAERRGENHSGFEVLAPIYEWFDEGLDTPDLQEARAALERLG